MQDTPKETDHSGPRVEWAERRTDWAEDRTRLANERTFAGWLRTALGSIAVAIGLHALFRQFEPDWIVKIVASGFILGAVVTIWMAERAASRTAQRMDRHEVSAQSRRRMTALAALLSLAALATGAILWLL